MPGPEDRTLIRPMAEGEEEQTPSRPQYQPPYIVVVEGPRTGARFPLSDGPNIIGRAPGNAVRLEDQSVSRQHAEIAKGASGWTVRDLGSKNGTYVNGRPIAETVVIGHKDVVKTGIYQMRLITQPTSLEEEMTLPPEIVMADRTVFVAAPPDGHTAEVRRKEVSEEAPMPPAAEEGMVDLGPIQEEAPSKPKSRRPLVLVALLGIVVFAVGIWYAQRVFFKLHKGKPAAPHVTEPQPQPPGPDQGQLQPGLDQGQPPPGLPPGTPPGTPPGVPPTAAPGVPPTAPGQPLPPPVAQTVPIFLDFASSPLPARVTFQGKDVGMTPLRINVELAADQTYQAQALFVMPEVQQQYTQQVDFTVEKDKSVVPILFRGPIGLLKVMDLPRDVQFYLEGKFSYDKFQGQSAKLNEIVLQKPIYIPYGTYVLELRRARQMGQSSPTTVPDIIFHRDFQISEDAPSYQLDVKEEDLKAFPVKIKTDPPNADVFVDGKLVGKSPYEGAFPLGEHKLTVRKEGYFEFSEDLKVDINVPFLGDVKLKTSVAGAHINNARLAMSRSLFQDAINELAEALNSQPAPSETALANVLLGRCYLALNDVQRAMSYFEQARANDAQRYPAMLGLANAYAILNRIDQALPLLVEVMLKNQDEDVKREAHDLFQKVSPFRSVIYVYSEPPGATVVVNDRPVAQQTPVILHELPLGTYRMRVEKPGFLPTDLNLSLSVNEFNPVIVKLRPIPQ